MTKEVLKLALEALEESQQFVQASADGKLHHGWGEQLDKADRAIAAIREALAAPQGEPSFGGVSDAQEQGSVPVSAHTTGESSGHLHPAPAPQGEPMAWLDEEIDCAYTQNDLNGSSTAGLRPLFAHPAPAPHTPNYTTEAEIAAWKAGYGHGAWSNTAPAPLTIEAIRNGGGIVHSDGNIFFTNIEKLNAAIERHVRGTK